MQLNTGDKLGNYEILSLLGEGGMGAVYKAKHVELSKIVALKVLKPELLQNKSFLQRFKIEAKAAAKLNHPNIVTVHDIGQEGDINYFILDYVQGEDLEEVIRRQGNLTYDKAKEIIKQIALALDYAHNNGIIHRDIKTRNIMIDEHGNAKLTDFGIARVTEETRLTSTGTFMGTVEYMSPEQAMGKTVDGRSDIYSLGIVFYELVTGDVPFKGDTTPIAVAMKHVNEKVISPRDLNGLIPDIGERIILRCLEKDPDIRFQTGRELAEAIEQEKLKEIRTQTGSLIKKNCPFCGEEIMASALKCKHCGTFLDKTKHKSTDSSKILVPVLTVSAVVIIGIIVIILVMTYMNNSKNQSQNVITPTIPPTIINTVSSPTFKKLINLSATASSSIISKYGHFTPDKLLDNDNTTCWQENVKGYGIGEWVQIQLPSPEDISYIEVRNGYAETNDPEYGNLYVLNSRVKNADIIFSNGTQHNITFTDTPNFQTFNISSNGKCNWMKLIINDVYYGNKWQDTCISDINIYAEGASSSSPLVSGGIFTGKVTGNWGQGQQIFNIEMNISFTSLNNGMYNASGTIKTYWDTGMVNSYVNGSLDSKSGEIRLNEPNKKGNGYYIGTLKNNRCIDGSYIYYYNDYQPYSFSVCK